MVDFFKNAWNKLKDTVEEEIQDLSYMEVITAVSDDVEKHIDNTGWDVLQSLRLGNPPSHYGEVQGQEKEITKDDMLTSENTEIIARTRIELDGDVLTILKGKDAKTAALSEDLMTLHNKGIEISVENWKMFLEFVLRLTALIGVMIGEVDAEKYTKIKSPEK